MGQSAAAAELLREWLTDHADDHVAWLLRARASMAEGDTFGARRCVEAAHRLAPQDPQTSLVHGYVAWKL
ncbi:MAG: tetratricopeptide repeat protein, partial [Planctomycetes bacterium]|nr:tetratricopeptide repeat protein [Planctomycetota bacterium]